MIEYDTDNIELKVRPTKQLSLVSKITTKIKTHHILLFLKPKLRKSYPTSISSLNKKN
jgi:hypothetical protein